MKYLVAFSVSHLFFSCQATWGSSVHPQVRAQAGIWEEVNADVSPLFGIPLHNFSGVGTPDLWLFKPVGLQHSSLVLAAVCSADSGVASREKPLKHGYHPVWFPSLKAIEFPSSSACVG